MHKSIVLILLSLTFAATGQVTLKQAMNNVGSLDSFTIAHLVAFLLKALGNPLVWFGFTLYGAAAFSWLIILSRENLSFVYPFAGLTFVLVMLLSAIIFKEQISLWRWFGSFIVVLGLIMVGRS